MVAFHDETVELELMDGAVEWPLQVMLERMLHLEHVVAVPAEVDAGVAFAMEMVLDAVAKDAAVVLASDEHPDANAVVADEPLIAVAVLLVVAVVVVHGQQL